MPSINGRKYHALILTLLLAVVLVNLQMINFFQLVRADYTLSETIYIRADGSIFPEDAPISTIDNIIYTLTDNITVNGPPYDGLVVERNNVIIDGVRRTLKAGEWRGWGITLKGSNITLKNISIENFAAGVYILGSANIVQGCNIASYRGIEILSQNNRIIDNNIKCGVYLLGSSNNNIIANRVAGTYSIYLHQACNNTIVGNTLRGSVSISFNSSGNMIYHNNFSIQLANIYVTGKNIWDNGYPSGGNYWDNYNGTDIYRGPKQNEPGSDGIGDKPYVINADNIDRYPLMNPYGVSQPPKYTLTITTTVGGTTDPAPGTYSYTVNSTIQVIAIPEANFTFERWELDGVNVGSANPISIFMNKSYTLHAIFSRPREPTAEFYVQSPYMPIHAGTPVTFNASSSLHGWNGTHAMPIIEYRWNFGDGNITSTHEPVLTHIYMKPGTFNVTLTVIDSAGLNSSTSKNLFVIMPTIISISTSSPPTLVGFKVEIYGTLSDLYGNGLKNQTVVIYYTFLGVDTWIPISSDITDNNGHYRIEWIPQATGYFTLKASWAGNTTHIGATSTVTLNSLSYANQYVFTVESNSTISALSFNTTDNTLSFNSSGPKGTTGYVKVTIAKSLVTNPQNIKVFIDGIPTEYVITSTSNSWLLTFTHMHSARRIMIMMGQASQSFFENPFGSVTIYATLIVAIIILIIFSINKKMRKHPRDKKTKFSSLKH